ncbi:lysine transporter LysE [Bacillus sp. VT-16-64]|nr:lysine transporter LysE [Bacillus sp. VT-16-64]
MYAEVFLVGILAGLSPGPDFVVVMKNSLMLGRKNGIFTALGISCALIVHITYTILGFTILLEKWPMLFQFVKLLGAGYLLWLGFQGIRSQAKPEASPVVSYQSTAPTTLRKSFWQGFLCNVLNPKSALFFLSIFSQFIDANTPGWLRWIYGGEIIFAVSLWFILLATLISNRYFRTFYQKHMHWFDRGLGAMLMIFGVIIGYTTVSYIAEEVVN